jgi:hypothetical protein
VECARVGEAQQESDLREFVVRIAEQLVGELARPVDELRRSGYKVNVRSF